MWLAYANSSSDQKSDIIWLHQVQGLEVSFHLSFAFNCIFIGESKFRLALENKRHTVSVSLANKTKVVIDYMQAAAVFSVKKPLHKVSKAKIHDEQWRNHSRLMHSVNMKCINLKHI